MRRNKVKEKLRNKQPSFGMGLLWPSPELVELSGYLGFEWIWLDLEHGAFDLQELTHVVRAAEAADLITIGRVAKTDDPEQLLAYMETGLTGIIASHVQTKEDVEVAVQAVKYPPRGTRSAGTLRPARWGAGPGSAEAWRAANEETMVMALVEEMEGIENLDEILTVDGLDAVVIGFGDLAMTLGLPGQKHHPRLVELGRLAYDKILASDKALQVTVQSGAEARAAVEQGALLVRCTAHTIFAQGARAWLREARNE